MKDRSTTTSLTTAQRRTVHQNFKVYRVEAFGFGTERWVYQPHDFDSSFDLWSDTYKTRREAVEAAHDEMMGPDFHGNQAE